MYVKRKKKKKLIVKNIHNIVEWNYFICQKNHFNYLVKWN